MKSRKFTVRELLLIIIAAVIGLGIFYYEVVYKGFQNSIEKYATEDLESQAIVLQAQVIKKKQMEKYIEENEGKELGEVTIYNNLSNEIKELDRIFASVDELVVTWSTPTLTETTVRRNANIAFEIVGYDNVVDLIIELTNCKYRCLLRDVSVAAEKDDLLNNIGNIKVSIDVTFFEKVDENSNLQGLTIVD